VQHVTERALYFQFIPRNDWPPLSWVARIRKGGQEVEVTHGPRVETNPNWICEAAWAGSFSEGDFDQTDLISGTGIRLRDGKAVFVSSGSTVDRIVSCETGDGIHVSNSLIGLAAVLNLAVDPLYKKFYEDFRTIVNGLENYKSIVETSNPPVRLTYFRNLVFDGERLTICDKPCGDRRFSSFNEYYGFLEESLTRIGRNIADTSRRYNYTPLGTLSTGYDSPTVAVLAKRIGNSEVLTFRHGRGGTDDDGSEIASRLNLKAIPLNRDIWRQQQGSEIPFIAANAYGEEAHYVAASSLLTGRLLLTGYHGDKVWDTSTHDLSPVIKRGDPSGLALTEWRLWIGFLHCPLPFFGVRNIDEIYRISMSDEMEPWRVGGDYDRPICRRIVEQEGIPRELFGTRKSAASVVLWDRNEGFLPPQSMNQYTSWLRRYQMQWLNRRQPPPIWAWRLHLLKASLLRTASKRSANGVSASDYLFRHLFPWAFEAAKLRYRNSADQPS
jgi:hypothetical protein